MASARVSECDALGFESVGLPALGTGTGGLSVRLCAGLLREALDPRKDNEGSLRRVDVALYDGPTTDVLADAGGSG